jgi:CubicO group peptidase (beta-lactamase class C family)
MTASMEPDQDELRLMVGSPPFTADRLVTLANWQQGPYNRWAFQHVRELIPTAAIPRGDGPVWELERDERDLSDIGFTTRDGELTVGELLDGTCTDGFLVLHRGVIVTEQYRNGLRPGTPHLLMSVSKSITGLVAGALAGRGALDVTATVDSIVPELKATSFRGATVQQLLDMRTGTKYSEDYRDPDAEIAVSDRVYLWSPDDGRPRPGDALEYFASLVNDGEHGGPFRYRSILVDVLAWVLERAADERFPDLVASELWQPMGAERDAEITVDSCGNPLADGGISATLRDAGRIGQLALQRGRAGTGGGGRQVVPADWLDDTVARRRRERLSPRRPLPQLLVGHRPRTPPVQRGRHPRPAHRRARPERDRRGQAVELAGPGRRGPPPGHRRRRYRDRGCARGRPVTGF